MTRQAAIQAVEDYFDNGSYERDLARRIAIPSTAQVAEHRQALYDYLQAEMTPSFESLGFCCQIFENPNPAGGPFLLAERMEAPTVPTLFCYGHGDVVRGQEAQWRDGLAPWTLTRIGERLYGRGTADNKGQHSIVIAALAAVLRERGQLGFNVKFLLEMSEETGSAGLREFCDQHQQRLQADLLIASDGPRLSPARPTLFMGTRGALNFALKVNLRDGGHHSGNWGGLLANPGVILAHALASIISAEGAINVPALKPVAIPATIRQALAGIEVEGGPDAPAIDRGWGEPELTPAERVFAWNSFEVLAFRTGQPERVVNAIPGEAQAWCQIRFTVDRDPLSFLPALRQHLDAHGFAAVEIVQDPEDVMMAATRLLPDHPLVQWAAASITASSGKAPAILPNLGGSLPNDVFADLLGLPTLWLPHSYAACCQHAPNEHLLAPLVREGLAIMAGLFWDLGEADAPVQRLNK